MSELSRIDLNKLHTFFAVAEFGGVTAAARQLALTPSAVSQGLTGLEASLGVRLFDRVGKQLLLTREGRLLHARFSSYQNELGDVLREVRNEEQSVRGTVRVGLFVGFPRDALVRFLARFAKNHPEAILRLRYGSREELRDALAEGRLDFAFALDAESPGDRIQATSLYEEELLLVARPALAKPRFDLARLSEVPVVDYYQSDPLIQRWAKHHFGKDAGALNVRVWAATTQLVLDLVKNRVGVGVVPRHMVASELERGTLRAIGPRRKPLRDVVWLKSRAGAWRSAALDAFENEALKELGTS